MKNCSLQGFIICLITMGCLISTGCSFEEGKGGDATIQGKIYVEDYNNSGMLVAEGWAQDWNVFISYGENTIVDDQTVTGMDGSYEFINLHVGDYTIFVYSECDACPSNIEPKSLQVTITGKSEVKVLADILVFD